MPGAPCTGHLYGAPAQGTLNGAPLRGARSARLHFCNFLLKVSRGLSVGGAQIQDVMLASRTKCATVVHRMLKTYNCYLFFVRKKCIFLCMFFQNEKWQHLHVFDTSVKTVARFVQVPPHLREFLLLKTCNCRTFHFANVQLSSFLCCKCATVVGFIVSRVALRRQWRYFFKNYFNILPIIFNTSGLPCRYPSTHV